MVPFLKSGLKLSLTFIASSWKDTIGKMRKVKVAYVIITSIKMLEDYLSQYDT